MNHQPRFLSIRPFVAFALCLAVAGLSRGSSQAAETKIAKESRTVKVALYHGKGTGGAGPTNLMVRLNQGKGVSLTRITPEEIRGGGLTNYAAVIFAGGMSSTQSKALGVVGREAVRKFVGDGGGYIGICAGAYLAACSYDTKLHLINAKTISPKWNRGGANVKMELSGDGKKLLGNRDGEFEVRYHNGPVVEPANEQSLEPYTVWASFRSEVAKNGTPPGIMVNSPAIYSGKFKAGRVVCISPHPEQTAGLEDFVPNAVDWVTSRTATPALP